MQLKEFLVKKLSLKLNKSERVIDTVITNQFQTAFQATSHHNTIELSGFGKFIFSQAKGIRKMNKYMVHKETCNASLSDPNNSEETNRKTQLRLNTISKNIEHLKPKLIDYEYKSNI